MRRLYFLFVILILATAFSSCSDDGVAHYIEQQFSREEQPPLEPDREIYENSDPYQVSTVYITVFPMPTGVENPYDFSDVNRDVNWRDDRVLELDCLFQEGDETGPKAGFFGFGLTDANASIRLRGHSTRSADQKSYRVDLKRRIGTWHGFREINLNKHPSDLTRFRNKLSFDLIKDLGTLPSLRTEFVHVYVKDLSEGDKDAPFEDYGLFTHVESVDRDWVRARKLDDSGSLYKAENYFFQIDKDLRLESDAKYDKDAFERIVEINGKGDHDTFLSMNNDVNNYLLDIDQVVNMHFQLDNYLTWMAINILMDNRDTNTQNFHLYSPKNLDVFYFIPWDFDGAWDYYNQIDSHENDIPAWRLGLSNYWSVSLHSRFFRSSDNILLLNQKIVDVYEALQDMNIEERIDAYNAVVEPFVSRDPDLSELPGSLDNRKIEVERLKSVLDLNLKRYHDSLEYPMPVFLGDVQLLGEYTLFTWDRSYDFQGDRLLYTVQLSRSPSFDEIAFEDVTRFNEHSIRNLPTGEWFWRVIVEDSKGHTQIAMDEYVDDAGVSYFGIMRFEQK